MSFNVALSGLNAASKDLAATGHNIANASTVGFKKSRVEFGDMYSGAFLTAGNNAVGSGVRVQDVRQMHSQGNISATDNGLDMAISGEGYFVLSNGGETRYTRAGQFGLSPDGFLQNNQGMRVQGYPANDAGNVSGILGDIQIQTGNLPPRATSAVNVGLNLDARDGLPAISASGADDVGTFDPQNVDTYNYSTSTTIYDSLGKPHTMTQYFARDWTSETSTDADGNPIDVAEAVPNAWNMYLYIDGKPSDLSGAASAPLSFTSAGSLEGQPKTFDVTVDTGDAGELSFSLDLSKATQFGEASGLNALTQDGHTTGRLTSLDVSDNGHVFGRYSNGRSMVLGQVALANFSNPEGLSPAGETTWVESMESGDPLVDKPGTGSLGGIKAGSVEESNVDLSQQLVGLIIAQRNFQANAKTIETSDAITQTIINLR